MRTQLHNWRILVDHIIDKVWEYIDELDMWDDRSEPKPVEELITTGEDGRKEPNVDAIEEFAYGWFDFRQV